MEGEHRSLRYNVNKFTKTRYITTYRQKLFSVFKVGCKPVIG